MGQVYIGAIPLLLLVHAAGRGLLWEREVRFFTIAGAAMLLYALGWYTPVFRLLYEALPGVALYRRPADATFLIGALAAGKAPPPAGPRRGGGRPACTSRERRGASRHPRW